MRAHEGRRRSSTPPWPCPHAHCRRACPQWAMVNMLLPPIEPPCHVCCPPAAGAGGLDIVLNAGAAQALGLGKGSTATHIKVRLRAWSKKWTRAFRPCLSALLTCVHSIAITSLAHLAHRPVAVCRAWAAAAARAGLPSAASWARCGWASTVSQACKPCTERARAATAVWSCRSTPAESCAAACWAAALWCTTTLVCVLQCGALRQRRRRRRPGSTAHTCSLPCVG